MTESEGQTARDAALELRDDGVPDLQDGTPGAEWAEDPEYMPIPGERPGASTDFGTTAEEQAGGEPLTQRLEREVPDDASAERRAGDPDYAVVQLDQDDDSRAEHSATASNSASERTADDLTASETPAVGGEGPEEDAIHVDEG